MQLFRVIMYEYCAWYIRKGERTRIAELYSYEGVKALAKCSNV
jgi:hypothetical protein